MAITNYTELRAAVTTMLNRDDLDGQVANFISLGEEVLNSRVRVKAMEEVVTQTLSTRTMALPNRFIEPKTMVIVTDSEPIAIGELDAVRFDAIASDSIYGTPTYFNVAQNIALDVVPASAISIAFRYYKKLDIETDLTNWLLTMFPSAYLYASLLQAELYLIDDQRVPVWREFLEDAIDRANGVGNKMTALLTTEGPW